MYADAGSAKRRASPSRTPTAQWQDILATGARVDRALARGDVRLTMGGEPTFVAATDIDAPEWNTDALGPTKRAYAGQADPPADGALVARRRRCNTCMGKQYPGEQLPRWALHCHWRADGETGLARSGPACASDDDTDTADAGRRRALRRRAGGAAAGRSGLVIPAYEDIHYYLWREHRLPANVVAEDAKLRDPLERARLARVFGQGLAAPVGSVLPLRRVMRRRRAPLAVRQLVLPRRRDVPDPRRFARSACACRWTACPGPIPTTIEPDVEPDPFAPRPPLPPRQAFRAAAASRGHGTPRHRRLPAGAAGRCR